MPSRVHPGEFFALPQSPQLFKQILMVAGMDRYVQICKCFRDEDLRADRQPEFTQVDVEMSFARPETIFGIIEPLMHEIFAVIGKTIETPFRADVRTPRRWRGYGSDKPDLRCGHADSGLRASSSATRPSASSARSSPAAARCAASSSSDVGGYSRSEVDGIVDQAKALGAAGLVWARRVDDGSVTSSVMKAFGEETVRQLLDLAGVPPGELLLIAAGAPEATSKLLGQLRLSLAKKESLLESDDYKFLVGRRLPAARVGRRGEALHRDAPSIHVAARRGPRRHGQRPGQGSGEGLRPRPERQRDRRRQHPYPRRRRCRAAYSRC